MPADRKLQTPVPVTRLGASPQRHAVGQPVALIHGLLESNAIWRTAGMDALFARRQAVALPIPGHHPWNVPPRALADLLRGDGLVEAYAETLRRTFDGRPVRIVGHSTGALVALEIARLHPELVASVCVVGALRNGRLLGSRSLARELACLPVIGPWAFRVALRAWLSGPQAFRAGLRSVMGAGVTVEDVPLGTMRDLRRSDPRSLHAMALGLRDWPGLTEAGRVAAPVFSIICAADPVVHPAQQLALARDLRRVRMLVLSSGHLPMLEQPAPFCDALRRWLDTPAVRIAPVRRPRGDEAPLAGTAASATTLAR